jgi:hypothetical protein
MRNGWYFLLVNNSQETIKRWIYFAIATALIFAAMMAVVISPDHLQFVKPFLPLALMIVMVAAGVNLHAILWRTRQSTMSKTAKALISTIATFVIFVGIAFVIGIVAAIVRRI